MRHLVTFILRLWVDPESTPAACEGQVECVATGAHLHIHSQAAVAEFIRTHLDPIPPAETAQGEIDVRKTIK